MLEQVKPNAVAICTPPGPRYAIARDCLEAGVHVLLEKPPCATLGEVTDLARLSKQSGVSLFTAWHAQSNDSVREAARIIAAEGLSQMHIDWLEDVDKWHPGQTWIWAAGGFGVFDAGINALSIATLLSPGILMLQHAEMIAHSPSRQPIAATLTMTSPDVDGPLDARLDWRHQGVERRDIEAVTKAGTRLKLTEGGSPLQIGDSEPIRGHRSEYRTLYEQFETLVRTHTSLIDAEPLRLTADAFLLADWADRDGT